MSRSITLLFAGLAAIGFLASPAAGQTPKPEETKASVPALEAMHEVIMPLWHEAWPNKDVKAMAALVPDIEKHASAVSKAVLPGILREKQAAWASGVADLQATVAAYKAAAGAGNDEALLKAAEKLHMQYEALVKLVRPVLKEMEDFHSSLYVLYHYQMEPFQLAKASESVQALKAKMDVLNKATLPARLQAKTEAFTAQRAMLGKAVDDVAAQLPGKDEAKIKAAIEAMHSAYENLEKVF